MMGQNNAMWSDAVFHVLAHVRETAHLAPSVFDARYVRWVERHIGPASGRFLAEDVAVLGVTLSTHESLAKAQCLAFLFDETAEATRFAEREVASLQHNEVSRPSILNLLQRNVCERDAVEHLWCAVHLELEAHQQLPRVSQDPEALTLCLTKVANCSPRLHEHQVRQVRSLCLRGRILKNEIWVGLPSDAAHVYETTGYETPWPSYDHIAWQAAHEATVHEVLQRAENIGISVGHDTLEHAAIALMFRRAIKYDLEREHAVWFGHFGQAPDPSRTVPAAEALIGGMEL